MAGEASGDQLGAEWAQALRQTHPDAQISFCGGPQMESVIQTTSLIPLDRLAYMGFAEVLMHLGAIRENFKVVKAHLRVHRPDIVLMVDYPGFNMRLARWIHRQGWRQEGMKVLQLVAPQVWAWKSGRVKALAAHYDHVYPILPFEADILMRAGVATSYFGHPALARIPKVPMENPREGLALLPGSRWQELKRHVGIWSQVAIELGVTAKWIRPAHWSERDYRALLEQYAPQGAHWPIVEGVSHVRQAAAALVASGTATLECALHGTPMVVAYRTSPISYAIGKRVIKVPYISLVNLILDRRAVEERIQDDCHAARLVQDLHDAQSGNATWFQTVVELRDALGSELAMKEIAKHAVAS